MFKFCFNSTTLRNLDLFDALRAIKSSGYDGVELTLNPSHMHPLGTSDARVREVGAFCADNEIKIVCVACGGDRLLGDEPYEPSLICADDAGRRRRLDLIQRSMEIANLLGSPVLNFNSGFLRDGVSPQQAEAHLQEAVTTLLQDRSELILVLEPEPGFFIGTTEAAYPFLQGFASPRFRLNLDIGHVFCSEADPYQAIEKALPFSRHIHIEDIKGRVHHHEIPGEGDIDFKRVLGAMVASGYDHFVSVELHHHDTQWERALTESRDYLCHQLQTMH